MPKPHGTPPLVMTLLFTTLFLTTGAGAIPIKVSEAPENLLANTLHTISSTKNKLRINIYEMKSPEIADAVIKKIEAGVDVHILMEGQPVGGMSDASLEIKNQIVAAMKSNTASPQCRFSLMEAPDAARSQLDKNRRFAFNHAKYMIVDDEIVSVGSENFSSSDQNSKKKNRGWQIVAKEAEAVAYYAKIFAADADRKAADIKELVNESLFSKVAALYRFTGTTPWVAQTNRFTVEDEGPMNFEAQGLEYVTSPDTSLSGLKKFLNTAQTSLDLELMTFSPRWGNSPEESPLLSEVMAAARRGVTVRVLLNDERVFGGGGATTLDSESKNVVTVELLNELAESEDLKLEGRIADVKAMGVSYIHNKGAIADRSRVLVSSINWNQNSVERNREAGVVIDSAEVGQHYLSLFDQDWQASEPEVDASGL